MARFFYNIAEYNDTFVVHLRLSCKKSYKKSFFLIYITIVRIDENKAYRHGGLYTSGRGQLIIFFYHSNTNTNRVSDNQSYLWKKVFKYTKTLFFNCVLQNTAGHKGLSSHPFLCLISCSACTLGWSTYAIFSKSLFKIIAQGANDTLFYAEFRTVFLFSLNFAILGGFRFEILKN